MTNRGYQPPHKASEMLCVSTKSLHRWAKGHKLPLESVIASPGGQYSYDVGKIGNWMKNNFLKQTRIPKQR